MPTPRLVPAAFLFACTTLASASACQPQSSASTTPGVATPSGPSATQLFQEFSAEFFPAYFTLNPVTGTALGDHSNDAAWPDMSAAGRAAQVQWAQAQLERSSAFDRAGLSLDERVDLDILRNQLELIVLEHEAAKTWTTNPLAWSYLMGGGLDTLVSRDFAPVDVRAQSLVQRLVGLPQLLTNASEAMADGAAIMAPHAVVAKQQLEGLRSLIRIEVPKKMAGASAETRTKLEAAGRTALTAIDAYEAEVFSEARMSAAKGQWRLGPKLFAKKLGLTLGQVVDATALYGRAQSEQAKVRQRMEMLAFELYEPLFGRRPPGGADELGRSAVVREVLTELAKIHATPESLRDACEANLATITEFVERKKIIPLDPKAPLEVIWTPPHQQGVAIAGLDPAPPLDTSDSLQSFYLVQPLPKAWSEDVRESFLREYNHFMLEILSIHEAIPGHFVQLYYSARDSSTVRRAFGNGPFIEGWAVYTEKVMVDAGYAGVDPTAGKERPANISERLWKVAADPALRAKAIALHGSKFYLRAVTNAMLDHDIHAGNMDEAAAMKLMVEKAYQQEGEARGKWIRAQVTSTQLSSYFVGAAGWFDLRAKAEAEQGDAFDMSAWHAEVISHGAPPIPAMSEIMAGPLDAEQPQRAAE